MIWAVAAFATVSLQSCRLGSSSWLTNCAFIRVKRFLLNGASVSACTLYTCGCLHRSQAPCMSSLTNTRGLQVKTAAVLLLLLTASGSSEGMRTLEVSGASSVVWYEMLTICSSWKLGWDQEQLPSGDGRLLFDYSTRATDPTTSPAWAQEMASALPFMTASHALVQSLLDQTSAIVKTQLELKHMYLTVATAIGANKWNSAALEPSKAPSNPVSQAASWLCKSAATIADDWALYPFLRQSLNHDAILRQHDVDMGSLLMIAQEQKELQQKAHSVLQSTQGRCAELLLQVLQGMMFGIGFPSLMGVQQQMEKDALVRYGACPVNAPSMFCRLRPWQQSLVCTQARLHLVLQGSSSHQQHLASCKSRDFTCAPCMPHNVILITGAGIAVSGMHALPCLQRCLCLPRTWDQCEHVTCLAWLVAARCA